MAGRRISFLFDEKCLASLRKRVASGPNVARPYTYHGLARLQHHNAIARILGNSDEVTFHWMLIESGQETPFWMEPLEIWRIMATPPPQVPAKLAWFNEAVSLSEVLGRNTASRILRDASADCAPWGGPRLTGTGAEKNFLRA